MKWNDPTMKHGKILVSCLELDFLGLVKGNLVGGGDFIYRGADDCCSQVWCFLPIFFCKIYHLFMCPGRGKKFGFKILFFLCEISFYFLEGSQPGLLCSNWGSHVEIEDLMLSLRIKLLLNLHMKSSNSTWDPQSHHSRPRLLTPLKLQKILSKILSKRLSKSLSKILLKRIWVTLRCWGKLSLVEARFSKWF